MGEFLTGASNENVGTKLGVGERCVSKIVSAHKERISLTDERGEERASEGGGRRDSRLEGSTPTISGRTRDKDSMKNRTEKRT